MCHDTFTWHQKGTGKIVGFLFGLYSREISSLPVQDKVSQLMSGIEAASLGGLHGIQEDERNSVIVKGEGIYVGVLWCERKTRTPCDSRR